MKTGGLGWYNGNWAIGLHSGAVHWLMHGPEYGQYKTSISTEVSMSELSREYLPWIPPAIEFRRAGLAMVALLASELPECIPVRACY